MVDMRRQQYHIVRISGDSSCETAERIPRVSDRRRLRLRLEHDRAAVGKSRDGAVTRGIEGDRRASYGAGDMLDCDWSSWTGDSPGSRLFALEAQDNRRGQHLVRGGLRGALRQ